MHGNVYEWCQDWYGDYPEAEATDPTGVIEGERRVLRGGCWGYFPEFCRSAYRSKSLPEARNFDIGFRLVCAGGPEVNLTPLVPGELAAIDRPNRPAEPPEVIPEIEGPLPESTEVMANDIGMELKLIPAAQFLMGSRRSEQGRNADEQLHRVTLTKPYFIGTREVTQRQWTEVMGTSPWKGKSYVKEGPNFPATYITYKDAVAFCKKLSSREGRPYRLPTEAEWELACRTGLATAFSFGNNPAALSAFAWFSENTSDADEEYAHSVGLKEPNRFGLYDMHGNVSEWCSDRYASYPEGDITDPEGAAGGENRIVRGGSWSNTPSQCRSAIRKSLTRDDRSSRVGLRVVCDVEEE